MATDDQIEDFVEAISLIQSSNAFNPYKDVCEVADSSESPRIRVENLKSVLKACISSEYCSLWIARDLGYRGGRRTGIALTDELYLRKYGELIGAKNLRKATKGVAVPERTAFVVQNILGRIRKSVFMWNVFPLHPYESNNQLSNRKHTTAEREMSRFAIEWLVKMLNIDVVVAIGRDAEAALGEMKLDAAAARHPSYGGQREFVETMLDLYGVVNPTTDQASLF